MHAFLSCARRTVIYKLRHSPAVILTETFEIRRTLLSCFHTTSFGLFTGTSSPTPHHALLPEEDMQHAQHAQHDRTEQQLSPALHPPALSMARSSVLGCCALLWPSVASMPYMGCIAWQVRQLTFFIMHAWANCEHAADR